MAAVVVIFVGLVVLVVFVVIRARATRKERLSGLTATRPVFSIAPPVRRLSALKRESL